MRGVRAQRRAWLGCVVAVVAVVAAHKVTLQSLATLQLLLCLIWL